MSKILYLDCFSGISGDMFLGALIDLGVPLVVVESELQKLRLSSEYHLHAEKIARSGIVGTSFQVHLRHDQPVVHSDHAHHAHDKHQTTHKHLDHNHNPSHSECPAYEHQTHGRTYADITKIIHESALKTSIKSLALAVFREIGVAEASVHGVDLENVHFHEVGAIDSIVDIVGGAIALDYLAIDRVVASSIADGSGTIRCQHGIIPVPVPAVLKMLENTGIPYITGTSDTELVTPTGFGLVKTLVDSYGSIPSMKIQATGYGFGQRDIGRLNALRVMLGEDLPQSLPMQFDPSEIDQVVLLSCHIDNSSAEDLGFLAQKLLESNAADVSYSAILMKKNRPGQLLTVVSPIDFEKQIVEIIFQHSGTIGIRREIIDRHIMRRTFSTIEIMGCPIRQKTVHWQHIARTYPEYDDLVALAIRQNISLEQARKLVDQALTNEKAK